MVFNNLAIVWARYLYLGILFFAAVTFFLILSIFFALIYKNRLLKRRKSIISKLEIWMTEIILEPERSTDFNLPDEISKILEKPFAKKVLLREMMKVKRSLHGTSAHNLEMLYHQLHLYKISIKRTISKKSHVKAQGLQELTMMKKHNLHAIVFSYTNHKDIMVRMEAQTALVRLQGFKALYFFDTLTYPLSEWHQLNLLHLLSSQSIPDKTDVLKWLRSSNSSVVHFTLKLIIEQHAEEYYNEVINCLQHKDEGVRLKAILYLGQMASFDTHAFLQPHYIIETNKNIRLCIIDQLHGNRSRDNFLFLKNLQDSSDADVKLAADKAVLYHTQNFQPLYLAITA